MGGFLRLEPLLACTVASCICGHDTGRRDELVESISIWTPSVMLPFFMLAGASLELPALGNVLPSAVIIVLMRIGSIWAGSVFSGLMIKRIWPSLATTEAAVNY